MNYDISVIPIPSPLTFTPAIQAIRLPSNGQIDSTFVDVTAVVSGWGSTSEGSGLFSVIQMNLNQNQIKY